MYRYSQNDVNYQSSHMETIHWQHWHEMSDNKRMKIKQQYCFDFKLPHDILYIQAILHSSLSWTLWSQDWIRGRQWYDNPNDLYPQQGNAKQLLSWIRFNFKWLQSSNHSTCISASTVFCKTHIRNVQIS